MTTDDLRAYLDAHGVDGAPTVPGFCAVEWRDSSGGHHISIVQAAEHGGHLCMWVGGRDDQCMKYTDCIVRHAPLPDFGAMARELEELRAKPRSMAPVGEGECPTCRGAGYIDDGRGAGPCSECLGSGRAAP